MFKKLLISLLLVVCMVFSSLNFVFAGAGKDGYYSYSPNDISWNVGTYEGDSFHFFSRNNTIIIYGDTKEFGKNKLIVIRNGYNVHLNFISSSTVYPKTKSLKEIRQELKKQNINPKIVYIRKNYDCDCVASHFPEENSGILGETYYSPENSAKIVVKAGTRVRAPFIWVKNIYYNTFDYQLFRFDDNDGRTWLQPTTIVFFTQETTIILEYGGFVLEKNDSEEEYYQKLSNIGWTEGMLNIFYY